MLEPTFHSGLESRSSRLRRASSGEPGAHALPDLLLIERARAAESPAIEALIRRYSGRLFRVAYSVLLDAPRAETSVVEAFRVAFSDLSRYEPTGKFAAWLTRLAYTEARGQSTGARRVISPSLEERMAEPASGAEAACERLALERSIAMLPEVFRIVYVLRMVEGISGIETAAALGLHQTTVRTRLFRAHRRLPPDMAQRVRAAPVLLELSAARAERIAHRALAELPHAPMQPGSAPAP